MFFQFSCTCVGSCNSLAYYYYLIDRSTWDVIYVQTELKSTMIQITCDWDVTWSNKTWGDTVKNRDVMRPSDRLLICLLLLLSHLLTPHNLLCSHASLHSFARLAADTHTQPSLQESSRWLRRPISCFWPCCNLFFRDEKKFQSRKLLSKKCHYKGDIWRYKQRHFSLLPPFWASAPKGDEVL